jgi:hypothetical protein
VSEAEERLSAFEPASISNSSLVTDLQSPENVARFGDRLIRDYLRRESAESVTNSMESTNN